MSIDPQVLQATTLRTLDPEAVRRRFAHVSIESIDTEPFPQSLRLIVSSRCGQHCQYPEEGILWCHNEGIRRDTLEPARVQRLLEVVHLFVEQYDLQSVKIGGLEPVLGQRLLDLIRDLRKLGFRDISFTTHGLGVNGRLTELKDAGITRITLSIHNLDRAIYQRISGRDGMPEALNLIEEAHEVGLAPIKVNRVLLRNYTDDLQDLVNLARAEDLTVRLFTLMWQPGHDQYYIKYFVSWEDFVPLWEDKIERVTMQHYRISWRTRVLFALNGGGNIEVNLLQPKWHSSVPICQSCSLAEICAEGYLGCGVRITPDLKLLPCILRSELARELGPLLHARQDQSHISLISSTLQGLL